MRTLPPDAPCSNAIRVRDPAILGRRALRLLTGVLVLGVVGTGLGVSPAAAEDTLLTSDCPEGVAVCRVDRSDAPASEDAAAETPATATAAPVEVARSAPLVLGNDDVGATRETLLEQAEAERKRREARAADEGAKPAGRDGAARDGVRDDEVWVSVPEDGRVVATGAEAGEARAALDVGLATCMERSIRAGNAFGESRRVCTAVFVPTSSSGTSETPRSSPAAPDGPSDTEPEGSPRRVP